MLPASRADMAVFTRLNELRQRGIDIIRHRGGWIIADLRKAPRYLGLGLWRDSLEGINATYRTPAQAIGRAEQLLEAPKAQEAQDVDDDMRGGDVGDGGGSVLRGGVR